MEEITNNKTQFSAKEEDIKEDTLTIIPIENKGEELDMVGEQRDDSIIESNEAKNELEMYVKPEKPPKEYKGKGGNPNWIKGVSANPKGRPKDRPFSLKADILKSLKRIKKKKPELYEEIIDSYWKDAKKREFLLEIIDGKARQSMELTGTMENPVRMIEVKPMAEEEKPDLSRAEK